MAFWGVAAASVASLIQQEIHTYTNGGLETTLFVVVVDRTIVDDYHSENVVQQHAPHLTRAAKHTGTRSIVFGTQAHL